MELTILLSKVFGIYFLVMGLFLIFRHGIFKNVVNAFAEEPALRFMMGLFLLVGGIFMVVSHQDWSNFPSGVVSFLGWAVGVKGLLYMNLTGSAVRKWAGFAKLNGRHAWVAGLLYIGMGAYLTNFAFGLY